MRHSDLVCVVERSAQNLRFDTKQSTRMGISSAIYKGYTFVRSHTGIGREDIGTFQEELASPVVEIPAT